jgi:hypothetical protein
MAFLLIGERHGWRKATYPSLARASIVTVLPPAATGDTEKAAESQ